MPITRRCIICGGRDEKNKLIRFSIIGDLFIEDTTNTIFGRGFYMHIDCRNYSQKVAVVSKKLLKRYKRRL